MKILLPWRKIDASICCRWPHRPGVIHPLARIDRGSILYSCRLWGDVPIDFMGTTIATAFTLAGVKKKADAWLRKQGYSLMEENMMVLL